MVKLIIPASVGIGLTECFRVVADFLVFILTGKDGYKEGQEGAGVCTGVDHQGGLKLQGTVCPV